MSISGRGFIWGFFQLLLIALIFAALYWLVGYLAAMWAFPAILTKVLYTVLVIGGVIVGINALIGIMGGNQFINWE